MPMSNGPYGAFKTNDSVVKPSAPSYCNPVPNFHCLFPTPIVPHGNTAVPQNIVHWPSLNALSVPGAS